MGNAYLDLLKSKEQKDVKIAHSPRRQAMKDQKGMCAKCKKDLNPSFSKFILGPTGTYTVICSNCAVTIPKR
ncbi:MAG: hypothetical protein PF542_00590 [Nanoarchaeota archaeon]|jgi:hypothetical protein|nr:hypothetical protein [Nanoarchaeota archaeon]